MPTEEERKSKLLAARKRARPISPTRFELGRKNFGIQDSASPKELLHTAQTRAAGARDVHDVADLETKRRAALMAGRLLRGWKGEAARQAVEEDEPRFGGRQDDIDQKEKLKQGRVLAMMERAMRKQAKIKQDEKSGVTRGEQNKLQEEVKKKMKAGFRRGIIVVIDFIAAAFDMSTTGITFLIDVSIYAFSLAWLNLELFYGKFFAKGKSKIISPLSWDPIPMPIDKDVMILSTFVIAADFLFGFMIIFFLFGGMCILHDVIYIFDNMALLVKMGSGIANGGTTGLCTGGILLSVFGL